MESEEQRAFGGAMDSVKALSEKSVQVTGSIRDAITARVETVTAKKPDEYASAVTEYNSAFALMNDHGLALFRIRERTVDLIELVEYLVNSIANTPKSFQKDFAEILACKSTFRAAEELAREELEAARGAAVGAGVGVAAGAAVASLAPTAAMWVATTYGVASTGTAISTLSGAAATNAALAWLGGGALATGGGGTAAGGALLALAGPVGWGVGGATVLVTIALFARSKIQGRETRQAELLAVRRNTAEVARMSAQIADLESRSAALREQVQRCYVNALGLHGTDFAVLEHPRQAELATLVNTTLAAAALLGHQVEHASSTDTEHASSDD